MNDDIHARYVKELADQGDWAGLVCYGLAHGLHMPAIDAAIEIVRSHDGNQALTDYLVAFRDEPIQPREAPSLDADSLNQHQQVALFLVSSFPMVALCEFAGQFPLNQQTQMYEMGLQTSEQWLGAAKLIEDKSLEAIAHGFRANAFRDLGQGEAAVASFTEALDSYRQLAEARPDVYLPDVKRR